MRIAHLSFLSLCLGLALCAACGDDGGLGGNSDFAVPKDLTAIPDLVVVPDMTFLPDLKPIQDLYDPRDFSGIQCGNQQCNTGSVCCVTMMGGMPVPSCMTSCPDGGITATCDGPEDCAGGGVCCATIMTGSGSFPNCPITANAACTMNACNFNIPFSCPGMGQARLCHKPADCAGDPNAANCCEFMQNNNKVTMCVSDFAKVAASKCL